ncbi:MAG: hypothetical protein WB791_04935 [Waddliaceae bacterium]
MTTLLPVTINGVEYQAHAEYTKGPIGQQYLDSLAVFERIFNLRADDPQEIIDFINGTAIQQEVENALWGGEVTGVDGNITTVEGLINLAAFGLPDENDPYDPTTPHFLTVQMVQSVDQLIQSLKAAGLQINGTDPTQVESQDIINWRNLAVSSDAIRRILQDAINVGANYNRSMQSLVELVYVRTGNQILSDNLEDLENALSTTKDSLETLNDLQNLHNNITAKGKGVFEEFAAAAYNIPGNANTPTRFLNGIQSLGEEFFDSIDPQILETFTVTDRDNFLKIRNELRLQISALSQTTPDLDDPGTLLAKIRVVYDGIQSALVKAGGSGSPGQVALALTLWTLDSYTDEGEIMVNTNTNFPINVDAFLDNVRQIINPFLGGFVITSAPGGPLPVAALPPITQERFIDDPAGTMGAILGILANISISGAASAAIALGSAWNQFQTVNPLSALSTVPANLGDSDGLIQRNINAAITAGQSLNDSQKSEVRRYLFVFEEYYKSASAILNKLTQILERIAQGIAR